MGMDLRIGRVTNVYGDTGRVKVMYEDEQSTSLPLPMLTMNQEYSMPTVGDRVVVLHRANGSSKGFVLGTYYGGGLQPKATSGYRKDFGNGAYAGCSGGEYLLVAKTVKIAADDVILSSSSGEISVNDLLKRLEKLESQIGT